MLIAAVLAALVGVTLGLLGGGGSILMLPILVYVLHVPAAEAVTLSLMVVGTTSAVAVVPHTRAGRVMWRAGLLFGAAGMAGALLGGRMSRQLPAKAILVAFAALMLVTAYKMLRGKPASYEGAARVTQAPLALTLGVLVGIVSGLVGAGGGFLVVPTLMLFGGLPLPRAIGTSLVVITMQSLAGAAIHLAHERVNLCLALGATLAAVLGSLLGAALSPHASQNTLRRGFAWLIVALACFMLGMEFLRPLLEKR